jgi:hypothetical protein
MKKMINVDIFENFVRSIIIKLMIIIMFHNNLNVLMMKAMVFYSENQGSNFITNAYMVNDVC